MNNDTLRILIPVILAFITAMMAPTVMERVKGTQKRNEFRDDVLAKQLEEARAELRSEQASIVRDLRLQNSTQRDALRDLERRHDELDQRCASMQRQLDVQASEVQRLQNENRQLKEKVSVLTEQNAGLMHEALDLRRKLEGRPP